MMAFTQTKMRAALAKAGITEVVNDLDRAIAVFLNITNNDVGLLQSRVDIAKRRIELSGAGQRGSAANGLNGPARPGQPELPSDGQNTDANDGLNISASARRPLEDGAGHYGTASNGHDVCASSSSSHRDGVGHVLRAKQGQNHDARPVVEPSPQARAAALRVAHSSAAKVLSLFDRVKTTGGERIGDIGEHELVGRARDGELFDAINDWLGPRSQKQRFKPIRELMSERQFEVVLDRVRGRNHD